MSALVWALPIALVALLVALGWGAIAARRDEASNLILHDGSRMADQPNLREIEP